MSEETNPSPRRARIAAALVALAIALLLFAGFLLIRGDSVPVASVALDRKLAELRTRDIPVTTEQMAAAFPDPAPDKDARAILQTAFSLLSDSRSVPTNLPFISWTPLPKRLDPIPEEMMRNIESYLTNSDAVMAAVPAKLNGIRFSMGWSNGFMNLPSAPVVEIRRLQHTLALTAIYKAELQQAREAAAALARGFGVAQTLNDDLLVSAMVRVACAGLTCDATERVLNRVALSTDALSELQGLLNPGFCNDFRRALIVERHMGMVALDGVRSVYTNMGDGRRLLLSMMEFFKRDRRPFYRDEDYLLFLEITDERSRLHGKTGLDQIRGHQELDTAFNSKARSSMATMVAPAWRKAVPGALKTKAKLTCARTAMAIERFRQANRGVLPSTLEELSPAFLEEPPRDPFDHQPLRYRKLARGFVIYSVGADGVDNGGVEPDSSEATTDVDVTFIVER